MAEPFADPFADPLGAAVGLVTRVESTMDPTLVEAVVAGVAGGRAKRRRLARALADNPRLLLDGRSPAPRVVGDLLIALRQAGAVAVSPPVCAECGKHLRTLQRRGEDWYCGVCGPRRERCAGCGNNRPVGSRDRDGHPRCAHCPPVDDRDPVEALVEVVAAADPTIGAATVVAAVQAAAPRAGQRRQLARALRNRPELLTGAGAEAEFPSVLRLIDELCDAGTSSVRRPACPHCGRVIALVKPRDGLRLCRNCVAKSRAEPCARCGVVREPATRDEDGRALCPHCLITDPANHEDCADCRRRRPVSVRTPRGPLCQACRPVPTLTCSICGRRAPCDISTATGRPWCRACKQRWARCAGCGLVRPTRGGSTDQPTCATCTRPDPAFWRACPTCLRVGQHHSGRCLHCTIGHRLQELLAGEDGQVRPELQTLHQAMAATERPATVARWLDHSDAPAVLRDLAAGRQPLTHGTLDELPARKPVEHLRAILVATGALPTRDEQMARLQRWTSRVIADRVDPDEQQLLHRYTAWHLLRRLRGRTAGTTTTHTQAAVVQQHVRAATGLLDWLSARSLTLPTCRQADLDAWHTSREATHRREAGHFLRWANNQKITTLALPAVRWGGPSGVIDTETRWQQARWLLADDTVEPADRVAGLLVLLYAQWPAVISRLTLTHVQTSGEEVRLQLGREPVLLPEPLAALAVALLATRTGHAALGDQGTSPWLFPGGQPGRPISAEHLNERLRRLGLRPAKPAPPHCSDSPPNSPPRSSPACSASTSASPSPGNAPAPATGPPTPPTTAAGHLSSTTGDRPPRSSSPAYRHHGNVTTLLLIHGGLWETGMDAERFWTRPGIVAGLRRRGFTVLAPNRLQRAPDWVTEADHLAPHLPDEPVTVLGGSNGCSTAARLALAVPKQIERLLLAWPATANDPAIDARTRCGLAELNASPAVIDALLAGHILRGVTNDELTSLTMPTGVLPSIPENLFHQRRTADALHAVMPHAEQLPGSPEPPRPDFPAHLPSFLDTVTRFASN